MQQNFEAATDAFLGQIAHEARNGGGGGRRDDDRSYSRRDSSYRSGSGGGPGGGSRYYDDRSPPRRRREDDGGYPDDRRKRRHYEDDRYRGGRDDRYSSRRDGYDRRDPYSGGGRRDYQDDGRWQRGQSPGAYHGRGSGGGGGGGGRKDWRSEEREPSPLVRRSPTPEGTVPISQHPRRANLWDIKPPGFESSSAAEAKASGIFGVPGQMRMLDTGALIGQNAGPGGNAAGAVSGIPGAAPVISQIGPGGSSMNRQARRLYVGNIGWEATEAAVCGFFNSKMHELGLVSKNLPGDDPCISSQINPEKGYAFVEFRSPEEATNAMAFDGIVFQSQSLKIRRPKDYVGPDVAAPSHIHVPNVVSTNVPDGPNKIFVGGLPTYLNDEQVMELLKAFGELRAFNLVREQGNGPSKGFAFCEYVDPSITELACQGLNDMELGDRRLIVQRASAGSGRGNAGGISVHARGPGGLELPPSFVSGTGQDAGEPTRCMQMLNMVTPEELTDDQEYSEIVEDVRDECARYGQVLDVRIPRPENESKGKAAQTWKQQSEAAAAAAEAAKAEGAEGENGEKAGEDGSAAANGSGEGKSGEREGVGRVYVKFAEVDQCAAALKAIAGRQFGGRVVIAAFLAEDNWPGDEDGGENADDTEKMATGPKQ